MKLTAITIANLKPRQADYRRADGGGLYILVRPNGSKLWRYDYRLGDVRRTLSIGEYNRDGDGKYGALGRRDRLGSAARAGPCSGCVADRVRHTMQWPRR